MLSGSPGAQGAWGFPVPGQELWGAPLGGGEHVQGNLLSSLAMGALVEFDPRRFL